MRRSTALFVMASPLLLTRIGLPCDSAQAHEFIIIRPEQFRAEKRIDTNAKEFDLPSLEATLVFSLQ